MSDEVEKSGWRGWIKPLLLALIPLAVGAIGSFAWVKWDTPLPPLAEQRRIVAKVEQLMALVDRLEAQLAESRAVGERLMAAVVAELTAAEGSGGDLLLEKSTQ